MLVRVVDASGLAIFGEPEAVAGRLGEARLVAPDLIGFELANVCLIKSRGDPEKRAMLPAALKLRDQFMLEEVSVDHVTVLELATATGLNRLRRQLPLVGSA